MDLKLLDAMPSEEERHVIDALLGPPPSQWEGGARGGAFDAHVAFGGHEARARRHLLLPALVALQERVGWLSEGGLNYVCERLTVPPADAWGVATFYALLATSPRPRRVLHVCDDIACRARGAKELAAELERTVGPALAHAPHGDHVVVDATQSCWMHSPCLGLCDHAPAGFLTVAGDRPQAHLVGGLTARQARDIVHGATPADPDAGTLSGARLPQRGPLERAGAPVLQLLRRVGVTDPTSLAAYRAAGGYKLLGDCLSGKHTRETIIKGVDDAGLRGLGGAGFPTGRKWTLVRQAPGPRLMAVNGDEGEPGTFKDRYYLERDPHRFIEGALIAAWAVGIDAIYIYLRDEYHGCRAILEQELAALAADPPFPLPAIHLRRGAGAYICGEESAMIESIEGKRGLPRHRPPYVAQVGPGLL